MPVFLGQLIYTSFPGVGLRALASAQVPIEIEQSFIQQVVYQHWDSYNPPNSGYRATYLHQVTPEHTLFGWLYNDEVDDLGRSHVPYFVCYYLAELLQAVQLENIFNCLQRGPVALIDRQSLPDALETIVVPDLSSYQPARIGVAIPSSVRDRSHIALQQRRLLGLFVPVDESGIVIELMPQAPASGQDTIPVLQGNLSQPHLGDNTSDANLATSPNKSAFLIGLGIGVASTLALMVASYYFLRSPAPAPKAQQYPVSIPLKNTAAVSPDG